MMPNPISEQAWRDQITEASNKAVAETHEQLIAMAEASIRRHWTTRQPFEPGDAEQLAEVLNEVQSESYLLGIRTGVTLVIDILKKQPEKKESEETKP